MVTIDWDSSPTAAPKIRDRNGLREIYRSDAFSDGTTGFSGGFAGNTSIKREADDKKALPKKLRGNGYTTNKRQGQSKARRKMSKKSRKENRNV